MTEKDALYFGALLHDVGKLFQRGDKNYQYIKHQLLSAAVMQELLGNTLVDAIVRYHHKKDLQVSGLTGQQRVLAELVCLADSLASQERTEDHSIQSQQPLHSIFNLIEIENRKQIQTHYQPLSRLNPTGYKFPTTEKLNLNIYEKIWESCKNELELAKNHPETLLYVYKKHLWSVPSSSWKSTPDVSLYEHSRLTAAIAMCLYDYFGAPTEVPSDLYDATQQRFMLVCGDLTGIQKFIYNIAHKGALKALKGRSFYLQHIVDAIARRILDELNLPLANLVYATGGKFYLILPNTQNVRAALEKIEYEVGKELLDDYEGDLGLIMGALPLSGNDFKSEHISAKWEEVNKIVGQNKRLKYAKFLNESDFFQPFGYGGATIRCYNTNRDLCEENELDGVSPENVGDGYQKYTLKHGDEIYKNVEGNYYISDEQYIAQKLGKSLRQGEWLNEDILQEKRVSTVRRRFHALDMQFPISNELGMQLTTVPKGKRAWRLNDDDFLTEMPQLSDRALGWKFYGGNYSTELDFEAIAKYGEGIEQLAVLRMDVDNLGLIFKNGLGNKASFSRMVQLSSMLEFFFCGYLNVLQDQKWDLHKGIQEGEGIEIKDLLQIVYAGGDDVFIVGVWHIMPDVATWIYDAFKRFTGQHDAFTLSAGISIFNAGVPVFKVAELAGNAESQAKSKSGKNAISFMDKALKWDAFVQVRKWATDFYSWIEEGKDGSKVTRGILQHLQMLNSMKEEEMRLLKRQSEAKGKKLTQTQLEEKANYGRWRWMAAYSLARFAKRHSAFEKEITGLSSHIFTHPQQLEHIALAARWAELLTRR